MVARHEPLQTRDRTAISGSKKGENMSFHTEHLAEGITCILGDCREVLPTLGKFDMVFTDPPYGHNNNNGDLIHRREQAIPSRRSKNDDGNKIYDARPIANDGPEETAALIGWFFEEISSHLEPGCCCCCCCGGGGGQDPQFARWALEMDKHMNFKQMVIWDKGPMGMGWHYRRSYETVLIAEIPGAACRWYDTTNKIENIIRPNYMGIKKIIPSSEEHPTPKPPELSRHFIRLHTEHGQTVIDPFMGGGSTGIAAVKDGRKFVGIELDKRWFDLSCRRISEALKQPDLFIEQPHKEEQLSLYQKG